MESGSKPRPGGQCHRDNQARKLRNDGPKTGNSMCKAQSTGGVQK